MKSGGRGCRAGANHLTIALAETSHGNYLLGDLDFEEWGPDDTVLILGTKANDNFNPTHQRDTIELGPGNDILGIGDDGFAHDIRGGTGSDTVFFFRDTSKANFTIDLSNGGDGEDIGDGSRMSSIENLDFYSGEGDDSIVCGGGDDRIAGGGETNILIGGDGADQLISSGTDTLDGGQGEDSAVLAKEGTNVGLWVDMTGGGTGGDIGDGTTVIAMEELLWWAGDGDDTLIAGDAKCDFDGWGGNDFFEANDLSNSFDGGRGRDTISYRTMDLGVVSGSRSSIENIVGSAFGDTLYGSTARNKLIGGDGDDMIVGLQGGDILDGGEGNDTVGYQSTTGVSVDLANMVADGGDAAGDVLSSFENVKSGLGNDVLTGSRRSNLLDAGAGQDKLSGLGGDDVLIAEDGPDIISGGKGIDQLVLSRSMVLDEALSIDISSGGGGIDIGDGTRVSGIEILNYTGGSQKDNVTGGKFGDSLSGGLDADTLTGGSGRDAFVFRTFWRGTILAALPQI